MPAPGTCDPATRGEAFNETALEYPLPDGTGSVLIVIRYGWDNVSVRPECDGPVISIHTRNTGASTAWAILINKKKGNPWVQVDPGTDVTVAQKGTLSNLGLVNYSDAAGVGMVFQDPLVVPFRTQLAQQ